jgi:hypothetical protein
MHVTHVTRETHVTQNLRIAVWQTQNRPDRLVRILITALKVILSWGGPDGRIIRPAASLSRIRPGRPNDSDRRIFSAAAAIGGPGRPARAGPTTWTDGLPLLLLLLPSVRPPGQSGPARRLGRTDFQSCRCDTPPLAVRVCPLCSWTGLARQSSRQTPSPKQISSRLSPHSPGMRQRPELWSSTLSGSRQAVPERQCSEGGSPPASAPKS